MIDAAGEVRALVEVHHLSKHFAAHGLWSLAGVALTRAVDDVLLSITEGTVMGLVGESGSGKTTLGRMLVRLVEPTSGQVLFDGRDITRLNDRDLLEYRRQAQIILLNRYSSLNPRRSVADSLGGGYNLFGIARGRERRTRITGPQLVDERTRPGQLGAGPFACHDQSHAVLRSGRGNRGGGCHCLRFQFAKLAYNDDHVGVR